MSFYNRRTRENVDSDELIILIQDACTAVGIEITFNNLNKLFTLMLSTTASYMYHNPTKYFRFPHFDIFRGNYKDNLLRIDINRDKDVQNAEDLLGFNLSEGMEKREFSKIMDKFVDTLMDYSEEKEEENSEVINNIKSKKKETKEKKHGN